MFQRAVFHRAVSRSRLGMAPVAAYGPIISKSGPGRCGSQNGLFQLVRPVALIQIPVGETRQNKPRVRPSRKSTARICAGTGPRDIEKLPTLGLRYNESERAILCIQVEVFLYLLFVPPGA